MWGILRRRDLRPHARFGQNFLVDANILRRVVEAGEIGPDDSVVEIGPGLGTLTLALAERARRVLAYEIDSGLVGVLREETLRGIPNVDLREADFMRVQLDQELPEALGPGRHLLIANMPYSITSPVIVRALEHRSLFRRIVLMMQEEVADRITADPDTRAYGSLTLFVHLYAVARKLAKVSRNVFTPVPKVDSAIVRLDIREQPAFPGVDEGRFLAVVQSCFQQRRKNLANALVSARTGWNREQALSVLEATGIDQRRRGETLTPADFARLAGAWPPELPLPRTRLRLK